MLEYDDSSVPFYQVVQLELGVFLISTSETQLFCLSLYPFALRSRLFQHLLRATNEGICTMPIRVFATVVRGLAE